MSFNNFSITCNKCKNVLHKLVKENNKIYLKCENKKCRNKEEIIVQ